jgi:hypothetical protein
MTPERHPGPAPNPSPAAHGEAEPAVATGAAERSSPSGIVGGGPPLDGAGNSGVASEAGANTDPAGGEEPTGGAG